MKFRKSLILVFLMLYVSNGWSLAVFQIPVIQQIDTLLKEADQLKYANLAVGLKKVYQAEKLAQKSKNEQKLGEVYTMLGIYKYLYGTYDVSLEMYLKAIYIHKKFKNDAFLARSLNGVGLIQSGFNQNHESIETFRESLEIDLKYNNYHGIARSYFNISISQIGLKQYEQATTSLRKSLLYSQKLKEEESNHMVENRLGDMMLIRNKPDSAFYYFENLLKDNTPPPNNWEKAYAYAGLAETYLSLKDYDNAEINAVKSYDYAFKLNTKWDLARIAKILSEVNFKKGKLIEAYDFLLENNALEDSLYNERKMSDVNYLQLKSMEVENLKLMNKNAITLQKAKRDRIIIYAFLLLTILLIGVLFLVRRNARLKDVFNNELNQKNENIENQKLLISKQNKALLNLNQSKNQLFSIISHDLRSPINSIVQVLELQKDKAFTQEMQDEIFEQLHKQTLATSNMLNNLLHWANTQLDGQVVNPENIDIASIVESVISSSLLEINKKGVTIVNAIPEQKLLITADIGQVRIIIQNVLANAIKFTPTKGTVDINYTEDEEFIKVHIIDSGKGITQEKIDQILNINKRMNSEQGTSFEEGTGLGLLLVKQFLANNNGLLNIKSGHTNGTEFIISFLKK
ncbi:tetratricopeptide repeat-containing sensor histidine kinase [Flavobacterium sp. SM2513]|uniref:tetratricopeptide repeat-containing sensor histidine kinase n=1 Tax=Flavobacterium sp. SM2513 TaxID=3424766 RepID=UPI003D7FEAD0